MPFTTLHTESGDKFTVITPYYDYENDEEALLGELSYSLFNRKIGVQSNHSFYYPEITAIRSDYWGEPFTRHHYLRNLFSDSISTYYPGLIYSGVSQVSYRDITVGLDMEIDTTKDLFITPFVSGKITGKLFHKNRISTQPVKEEKNSLQRNEFTITWHHLNPGKEIYTTPSSYFDSLSIQYGISNIMTLGYQSNYWIKDGIFPHRKNSVSLLSQIGQNNSIELSTSFYDHRDNLKSHSPFYTDFRNSYYEIRYARTSTQNTKQPQTYNSLHEAHYYFSGGYGFASGHAGFKNRVTGDFGIGLKKGFTISGAAYWEQLPQNTTKGKVKFTCIYDQSLHRVDKSDKGFRIGLSYTPFTYLKYNTQQYRLLGDPYYYYEHIFDGIGGVPYTIPKTVSVMYWNAELLFEKAFNRKHQVSVLLKSANTPVMNTSQIREGVGGKINYRKVFNRVLTIDLFFAAIASRGVKGTLLNENGDEYYFDNKLTPFATTETADIMGGINASFHF